MQTIRKLLIILLLLSNVTQAQKKSKEERQAILDTKKEKSKIDTDTILNKKCRVDSEYDKFEKVTIYTSSFNLFMDGSLIIELKKYSGDNYNHYYINATTPPDGCYSSSSYITFLLANSETVTFKHGIDIDCGVRTASFIADYEGLNKILRNKITDIRVYLDDNRDSKINEKQDLKIRSFIYCILHCN